MNKSLLLILLCLCLSAELRAQSSPSPAYRSFERIVPEADAAVVSCLLQDAQGMVWMGSNKGLFSYDGYSARPHFERGKRSHSRIYCGLSDSTRLYLGADNGLLIYNYRTDRYEPLPTNFPTDVRALAWFDGRLWLGTLNGLYTYHLPSGRLTTVSEGLPHHTVYSLAACNGCLYIGTYDGCARYRPDTRAVERVALPAGQGRSNLFVNALLDDKRRHCLWIGMEGSLLKYLPATGEVETVDGFRDNSVKALLVDADGRLLAGTDNGLYVYTEDSPLQHVVHDSRNPQSLSDNIVWTLFADRDRNVWLGTDYGVSMSRRDAPLHHVPLARLTGTGEGNQFYAMCRDRRGRFWFGGTNGIVSFAGEEGGDVRWYKMGDPRHAISHNRVRQIVEDRDGLLWAATDGGVNRYDPQRDCFIPYNIVDSTRRYNANWAYNLYEDDRHRLWIATCLGGIFVVDKERLLRADANSPYEAEHNYTQDNGLSGTFVSQLAPDREGNIWAMLYNSPCAVEKINAQTGQVTHIQALPDSHITPNFMLPAADGTIWLGYPGGVTRLSPSDGSATHLTFDPAHRHEVLSMTEGLGRIWLSTTDGLWMIDPQQMEVRRLNVSDHRFTGMLFDSVSARLYLGMADGFAVCSPRHLDTRHPERPLLLTGLYVNNRPYRPDSLEAEGSIRYASRLRLNSDQDNLALDISDLPYALGEKSRLVYRLEDGDAAWIQLPTNVNRISLSNLGYGNHRLSVRKLDACGQPDPSTAYHLDIRILPPWPYTWWARTLYALLLLTLVAWAVHFFRVKHRLKLVRREKEQLLEQSRAKMEFFTNLSHDLKTPLSMVIAPVSRLLAQVGNRPLRQELEQVQRNAMKLNALIHQGLDIDRVENGENALLIWSQIELVSFARGLFDLYATENRHRERGLDFRFHAACQKLYVQVDAIKLESIIDNLLGNAVKYTPSGGTVTLSVSRGEGGRDVYIAVADTGIGIALREQPYVFQRFYQSPQTAGKQEGTGIGLYLVKTYAELHGGTVTLRSVEGAGTTFTVTLPVACADAPAAPRPTDEGTPAPPDAPLVLVADDDADTAAFIAQILSPHCRCVLATDGKDALDKAMQTQPDLVVSDVMMPGMDGFELVRRLKSHVPTSTIPIILLTARDDRETELESIRLHSDAFITKPFEPDILLSRVEQLLHSRSSQEAKARLEALATPKPPEAVSQDEKFLSDITHLIEEHIADSELNVTALCHWSSVPSKQMYRKVKQLTGLTPVEYIKSIRMKKAAMLLRQQTFTVAEVMYLVGFSNHSYFSKCFQAAFGVTPKEYISTKSEG